MGQCVINEQKIEFTCDDAAAFCMSCLCQIAILCSKSDRGGGQGPPFIAVLFERDQHVQQYPPRFLVLMERGTPVQSRSRSLVDAGDVVGLSLKEFFNGRKFGRKQRMAMRKSLIEPSMFPQDAISHLTPRCINHFLL